MGKISASVMCADALNLQRDLGELERAGVDLLHCDIMDNAFVPNLTLSPGHVCRLREATAIPLDIHLMVCDPDSLLDRLQPAGKDIVTVHLESTPHLQRTLSRIRQLGCRAGVALNPSTPVESVREVLEDVDLVLLMTVNPGFAGQPLVPQCMGKIRRMRRFLDRHGCREIPIEVDGNVSFHHARQMRAAGAGYFVAGSSSVFSPRTGIGDGVRLLREAIA